MFTKNKNETILVCDCNSIEHQMLILKYDDGVYVDIHLNKIPFWKRLIYGIKYIFGYQSIYGAFDEFIFKKEHADKLIEVGNYLNSLKNENNN